MIIKVFAWFHVMGFCLLFGIKCNETFSDTTFGICLSTHFHLGPHKVWSYFFMVWSLQISVVRDSVVRGRGASGERAKSPKGWGWTEAVNMFKWQFCHLNKLIQFDMGKDEDLKIITPVLCMIKMAILDLIGYIKFFD